MPKPVHKKIAKKKPPGKCARSEEQEALEIIHKLLGDKGLAVRYQLQEGDEVRSVLSASRMNDGGWIFANIRYVNDVLRIRYVGKSNPNVLPTNLTTGWGD